MPTPRKVPWEKHDGQYAGDFDKRKEVQVTIGAGGDVDFEYEAANAVLFYRMLFENASANAWTVKLFGKDARAAADEIYSTLSRTGDYTYNQNGNVGPIVYVDEDGGNIVRGTAYGTAGDVIDMTFDQIRSP